MFSLKTLISLALLAHPLCFAGNGIDGPLFQANRNPLVSIFGLPPAESAQLLPSDGQSFSFVVDVANSFSFHRVEREFILLDGETARTTLVWRKKWTGRLELGLDVPFVQHGGGHLDALISNWHHFVGISTGDRQTAPDDQFRFTYIRDGEVQLDASRALRGLGDIRVAVAWQVYSWQGRWWALRAGLKLPTGDPDDLLGSGSVDGNVGIHFRNSLSFFSCPLALELSGGILATGDGEVVLDHRRNLALYGSSLLAVPVVDWFVFRVQLDAHGPLYESRLRELGRGSTQLTMGVGIVPRHGWAVSLAVAEEIIADAAPDVVLSLSLRYEFRKSH